MTDREERIVVSPGYNNVTVRIGGAEVTVSVIDGALIVDVSAPGEIDPTVFRLHPDFGTAVVGFRKNGESTSWRELDLHPFNSY